MAHAAFTRAAAQAKVGKRVRTRVAFAGVPRGAIATIIRADRVIGGYDVEVAWVWLGRRTPWIDWMTKAEYEGASSNCERPGVVATLATPDTHGEFPEMDPHRHGRSAIE
jgi:hypothetical protein